MFLIMDRYLEEVITGTTGINVHYYREGIMRRRVKRRMSFNKIDSQKEYAEFLKENDEEIEELLKTLTIGVTEFFRYRPYYDNLEEILKERFSGEKIKIWSAGCSTGEEPYSLAILLDKIGFEYEILATDIDKSKLDFARKGVYSPDKVDMLDNEIISKYFEPKESFFKIKEDYKKKIEFMQHDIISDGIIGSFDVISCRNTVKFFTKKITETVFINFHMSLNKNGVLGLGIAESLPKKLEGNLFRSLKKKDALFEKI